MRGFTKIKKKHLLKISAVYLIGKAEICQDPPSWGQDDQTLLWHEIYPATYFLIKNQKTTTYFSDLKQMTKFSKHDNQFE